MMRTLRLPRALPALVLLCLLALPTGASAAADLSELRDLALKLVNETRARHDLSQLTLAGPLNEAAQAHAEAMAEQDFFAHVSPDGGTVMDRYEAAGGAAESKLVAENLARCRNCTRRAPAEQLRSFHEGWMDSPGHRENILRPGLRHFGFGWHSWGENGIVAVQTFAGPGAADGTAVSDEQATAMALERINEARQEAGVAPLTLAPDLTQALAEQVPDDLSAFDPGGLDVPVRAGSWRQVYLMVGRCGGCGTQPVAGDIDRFVSGWLERGRYLQALLSPEYESLGFVLEADGSGRKVALAAVAG